MPNSHPPSKAAFFDLDFTFVNLNSSYAFIPFYLTRNKRFLKLAILVIFQFLSYLGITKALGAERLIYYKFLKGETKQQLEKTAQLFVQQKLINYINRPVLDIFHQRQNDGYRTVLISATISPVAEAFARKLNFDLCLSSQLSYQNNVYDGVLTLDLTEKKHHQLPAIVKELGSPINTEESYFLSDNQNDLELMRLIPDSQAVVYDSFQDRYWQDRGIKTLFVPPNNSPLRFYFFIPASYYFKTRKPIRDLLLVHLPFFAAAFCFGFAAIQNTPLWPLYFLLSWITYLAVYEIGYFLNDLLALTREKTPTLNLDPLTTSFIKFYIPTRLAFATLVLAIFSLNKNLNLPLYLAALLITLLVFLIHNFLPRPARLLTFPALKLSHLLVPLAIFTTVNLPSLLALITGFYLIKEMIYYYRKVNKLREWNAQLKARFIVAPKLLALALLLILAALHPSLVGLFFVGLSLSFIELGFVGKFLLKFAKKRL